MDSEHAARLAHRDGPARSPRLHGIIVTFRRNALLRRLLQQLANQERRLDSLIVVDNHPHPANDASVDEYRESTHTPTEYVPSRANTGPAGGISLGMRRILEYASDDDWLMLFDDDNHELDPQELLNLLAFALDSVSRDPRTAGIGERGGTFSWAKARARMVPVAPGAVNAKPVDYLAGNGLPTYRVGAIRESGTFAEELFFGLDDLEYGLRLRARGFSLLKMSRLAGPLPPPKQQQRRRFIDRDRPSWRHYYSLRNLIGILRQHRHPVAAAQVTVLRGVLKPLTCLPIAPRNAARRLALNSAAIRDAWSGRMGRCVEPSGAEYRPLPSAPNSDG